MAVLLVSSLAGDGHSGHMESSPYHWLRLVGAERTSQTAQIRKLTSMRASSSQPLTTVSIGTASPATLPLCASVPALVGVPLPLPTLGTVKGLLCARMVSPVLRPTLPSCTELTMS